MLNLSDVLDEYDPVNSSGPSGTLSRTHFECKHCERQADDEAEPVLRMWGTRKR